MIVPRKPKKIRSVYLDHAAATPVDGQVLRAMKPFFEVQFENPSALYKGAVVAREAVEQARKRVAEVLATPSDTIFFTSSATESVNLAIAGVLETTLKKWKGRKKPHVITTAIEHHAGLLPIERYEKEGKITATYIRPDARCIVSVEAVKKALRKETVLVSIMHANNEIGSIQPIADSGRAILRWRQSHKSTFPYFHSDAAQATNYLSLRVDALHIDLLSFNAAKMYGPKGVGVLYKRRGVEIEPICIGGGQEKGLRSGTENVPGFIGCAAALAIAQKLQTKETERLRKLLMYFWEQISSHIPDALLNGPSVDSPDRLSNNLNVSFCGTDAESLIIYLDAYGISAGTGSACATGQEEGSHVLHAIGRKQEEIKGSVRFTLGRATTKQDIAYVMNYLPKIVAAVRAMKKISTV